MTSVDRGCVESYYADRLKNPDGYNAVSTVCDLGEQVLNDRVKAALKNVHPDILTKSFGCGSPFPPLLEGCSIIDLGSGTGRDCFVISQLVGSNGCVVGVDMTPDMLSTANGHIPYHQEKTGLSNVEFRKAVLEDLVASSGLKEGSFDVVVSNCVVNLTSNKAKVFEDVFRLLKPGGEMFFSDVYALTEIPAAARKHVEAWNEGYGGALTLDEFAQMAKRTGFLGPFVAKSTPYRAHDKMKDLLAGCSYVANTVRLIKPLPPVENVPTKLTYLRDERFTFADKCCVEPNSHVTFPADVMEAVVRSRYGAFFE